MAAAGVNLNTGYTSLLKKLIARNGMNTEKGENSLTLTVFICWNHDIKSRIGH